MSLLFAISLLTVATFAETGSIVPVLNAFVNTSVFAIVPLAVRNL